MPEIRPDDAVLAKVLSGEGTAEENAAVARWEAGAPHAAAELAQLRTAWSAPVTASATGWDVDRGWRAVAARTVDEAPAHTSASRPWLRIAAGLVVLVGAGMLWRGITQERGQPLQYATAAGERREVVLSDGSRVVLAPRSSLTVSASYGRGDRDLELTGEAWFSAQHAGAPFRVTAGAHLVRDIGTVFTVSTRGTGATEVTVVEGSVAVTDGASRETVLVAGDVGRFATDAALQLVHAQPTSALASWTDGRLDLVDVRADAVAERLGRWHGVVITFADTATAARPVTITLALDSLDAAVADLALLLGVTVERSGSSVRFR
jgi:transmembrane sensor